MTYRTGHVKRNPQNDEVAVRTMFDADLFPHNVWLVASVGSGAKTAEAAYVEGWVDLYTPPEPEPVTPEPAVVEEAAPTYVTLPPIIEIDG